ncbi:hypothetical protein PVK06_043539 [Gossypium arboreum]|uniref:Retrotransposon Copia-like N-terminal domain-containing protein n=1 Tax=Gossypium arboreum TaxID=29729 RepID=A0ABR0MNR5_GOSAR|nr:hypothetical protein PVK06_043539 [Gossypium arboreum]
MIKFRVGFYPGLTSSSNMSPTPLISILTKNKLNGDNYREWKQNMLIALNCEKQKLVLEKMCPPKAQPKVRNH